MSNTTGPPTGRYFDWLAESAKEAEKQRMLPARVLAACEAKGDWILGGCPGDGRRNTHPHVELRKEITLRIEGHAASRGISTESLNKARREVSALPLSEMLTLASHPLFEQLMPDTVLVMDVHAR